LIQCGHLSQPMSSQTLPPLDVICATYRRLLPSFCANRTCDAYISSSDGSAAMNSSTVRSVHVCGYIGSEVKLLISSGQPAVRASINAFRTKYHERSNHPPRIRFCIAHILCICNSDRIWDTQFQCSTQKTPKVPLTEASMLVISSPVSSRYRNVEMIGRPAPTVASYRIEGLS